MTGRAFWNVPVAWRATAAVAAVSAIVAALVSAITTVLIISQVGPSQTPVADSTSISSRTPTSSVSATAPSGTPPDLAATFRAVASGVVRIETTACSQGSVGSGFLVGTDLVATVAHVVAGAHSVVLTVAGTSTPGTVVGIDPVREVALIKMARPVAGFIFRLSPNQPEVGTDVAALGFPLGGGLALSRGTVSALDRSLSVGPPALTAASPATTPSLPAASSPSATATAGSSVLTGLLQLDGLVNRGASGGPLITRDGTVVGLVEARAAEGEGIGYAVPAAKARDLIAHWQSAPQPVAVLGDCAAPVGPAQVDAPVTDRSGSVDGPGIARVLSRYATLINAGRYDEAFQLLTPAAQQRTSIENYRAGLRSSFLFDIVLKSVTASTADHSSAQVGLTTVQDAAFGPSGSGQTCSLWNLTYAMVKVGTAWQIDRAKPSGGPPAAC